MFDQNYGIWPWKCGSPRHSNVFVDINKTSVLFFNLHSKNKTSGFEFQDLKAQKKTKILKIFKIYSQKNRHPQSQNKNRKMNATFFRDNFLSRWHYECVRLAYCQFFLFWLSVSRRKVTFLLLHIKVFQLSLNLDHQLDFFGFFFQFYKTS